MKNIQKNKCAITKTDLRKSKGSCNILIDNYNLKDDIIAPVTLHWSNMNKPIDVIKMCGSNNQSSHYKNCKNFFVNGRLPFSTLDNIIQPLDNNTLYDKQTDSENLEQISSNSVRYKNTTLKTPRVKLYHTWGHEQKNILPLRTDYALALQDVEKQNDVNKIRDIQNHLFTNPKITVRSGYSSNISGNYLSLNNIQFSNFKKLDNTKENEQRNLIIFGKDLSDPERAKNIDNTKKIDADQTITEFIINSWSSDFNKTTEQNETEQISTYVDLLTRLKFPKYIKKDLGCAPNNFTTVQFDDSDYKLTIKEYIPIVPKVDDFISIAYNEYDTEPEKTRKETERKKIRQKIGEHNAIFYDLKKQLIKIFNMKITENEQSRIIETIQKEQKEMENPLYRETEKNDIYKKIVENTIIKILNIDTQFGIDTSGEFKFINNKRNINTQKFLVNKSDIKTTKIQNTKLSLSNYFCGYELTYNRNNKFHFKTVLDTVIKAEKENNEKKAEIRTKRLQYLRNHNELSLPKYQIDKIYQHGEEKQMKSSLSFEHFTQHTNFMNRLFYIIIILFLSYFIFT